jgi:hypothetical protein
VARVEFEDLLAELVPRAPAPVWAYDFRMWRTLDLGLPVDVAADLPTADLTP